MIKVVNDLPTDFLNDRRKQITRDFDEIIKNRIHYCEIVDSGYQVSSLRDVAIRVTCYLSRKYSGDVRGMDAFRFHILKNEKNRTGFFVEFNSDIWDQTVNNDVKNRSEKVMHFLEEG